MSSSRTPAGPEWDPAFIGSSESWQVLLTHLEYHTGFAFALLLLPDPAMAGSCKELLARHLAASGKTLLDVSPRSIPTCLELSSELGFLRTDATTEMVWVEFPISELDPEFPAWSQAIHQAFAQINSIRNLLQQQIGCTLLFAAPIWLQPVIRTMAPDLWSIRSLVVQIEPPKAAASGGKQLSESTSSASDSPDPHFALEQAAAMRGRPGQEIALYNALYRAGVGFLRLGQLEDAEAALRESLALCDRSNLPAANVASTELVLAETLTQAGQPDTEIRQLFESAIARLRDATDISPLADALRRYGNFLLSRRNLTDAASVLTDAMNLSKSSGDELGFANDAALLGITLWNQRDLQGARNLEEQVVEIRRRILGSEHPNTLTAMNNLTRTLFDLGDLTGALRLDEQVLESRRRILGDENPDTLSSMHNLARNLSALGDHAGALRLDQRVLEARTRILGEEHPDTLSSMNNLADDLSNMGDLARARSLNEKVYEARKRLLGGEHPKTLITLNNLAQNISEAGDQAEARRLQEQVLEARTRILGEEHPDTLVSMDNLAVTISRQGDHAGAKSLQEKVLEGSRRTFGEEHPDTLTSTNNLARTLAALGDHAEARRLDEEVLNIRTRTLGDEHPDTLTSKNNFARDVSLLGDHAEARRLDEEVLQSRKKILGEEHPNTLTSMSNLAIDLWDEAEYAGAQALEEKVLQARRRIYGENHPGTLTSMGNLARTLWSQGEFAKAKELEEQVLEARHRVLGEAHSDTLLAMDNLARTLKDLGDATGAAELEERAGRLRLGTSNGDAVDELKEQSETLPH